MDPDEHVSDAGIRAAFEAWSEAWARAAAGDVIRTAREVQEERDEEMRQNPRRKRATRR